MELTTMTYYVEPLDTYSDMSHVLQRETWPNPIGPKSVGYFCGILDDVANETQQAATERAKQSALAFLRNDVGKLWPAAVDADGVFDWNVLFDASKAQGEARFDAQYWRANIDGSERYVLSPPGLIAHRLRSNESGFDNLALAGDWTRNGINAGCVEAATISGLQAARAISGFPEHIAGEHDDWLGEPPTC